MSDVGHGKLAMKKVLRQLERNFWIFELAAGILMIWSGRHPDSMVTMIGWFISA
jgi:hypothetical protein